MLLRDIISVRGTSGLFKLLKVTRNGLLLETIDEKKIKLIKNINFSKATPLDNIAIYSKSGANPLPIAEVFNSMKDNINALEGLTSKSSNEEIKEAMMKVMPDYDDDKLHPSQILKLISWFKIIDKFVPEFFIIKKEIEKEIEKAKKKAKEKAKEKEKKEVKNSGKNKVEKEVKNSGKNKLKKEEKREKVIEKKSKDSDIVSKNKKNT